MFQIYASALYSYFKGPRNACGVGRVRCTATLYGQLTSMGGVSMPIKVESDVSEVLVESCHKAFFIRTPPAH